LLDRSRDRSVGSTLQHGTTLLSEDVVAKLVLEGHPGTSAHAVSRGVEALVVGVVAEGGDAFEEVGG